MNNKNENQNLDLNSIMNDIPQSSVNNQNTNSNVVEKKEPTSSSNEVIGNVEETKVEESKPDLMKPSGVIPAPEEKQEEDVNPNAINIGIEDNSLPTFNNNAATIGEIKPDKQKSPVAMIMLFALLIGFIIFMPQVITLVNKYLGTNLNTNNGVDFNNNTTPDNTDDNQDNDTRIYTISSSLSIKLGDITISGFEKLQDNSKYQIKFSVQNTSSSTYQFTKKLYLDFYNSNNTFIERKLIDITSLTSGGSTQMTTEISKEVNDTGGKVEASLRDADDYPQVILSNNTLKCSKDSRTITYTFKNDKLVAINDTYKYLKSSDLEQYSNELIQKKMDVSSMDSIDGVTAVLIEDESGYVTTININYETASFASLTYKDKYYDKDTLSKVVDFELKSSGFTCVK